MVFVFPQSFDSNDPEVSYVLENPPNPRHAVDQIVMEIVIMVHSLVGSV